jgi:hypothetical protein
VKLSFNNISKKRFLKDITETQTVSTTSRAQCVFHNGQAQFAQTPRNQANGVKASPVWAKPSIQVCCGGIGRVHQHQSQDLSTVLVCKEKVRDRHLFLNWKQLFLQKKQTMRSFLKTCKRNIPAHSILSKQIPRTGLLPHIHPDPATQTSLPRADAPNENGSVLQN